MSSQPSASQPTLTRGPVMINPCEQYQVGAASGTSETATAELRPIRAPSPSRMAVISLSYSEGKTIVIEVNQMKRELTDTFRTNIMRDTGHEHFQERVAFLFLCTRLISSQQKPMSLPPSSSYCHLPRDLMMSARGRGFVIKYPAREK